jgi:hypothetical protein
MIEAKFNEFLRSPLGILLIVGILCLAGAGVFLYVAYVFRNLVSFTPAPL